MPGCLAAHWVTLRTIRLASMLGIVAVPSALASQGETKLSVADEYMATVDRYRGGEIDAAIRELRSHDGPWVAEALESVQRSHWATVDLEAAALLHVETALSPHTSYLSREPHLAAAWRILDVDHGTRLPQEFQQRLYLLVAWYLQAEWRLDDLAVHMDLLVKHFPSDAATLLTLGSLYETLGWFREPPIDLVPRRTWRRSSTSPRPQVLKAIEGRNQRRILEEAAATFRRALTTSPDMDEAQLRLGHVLIELNRPDEALQELGPLRERETAARFKYVAALFEGRVHQSAGRPESAEEAYGFASTLYPGCQTPWIALSEVLRARGDRSAAGGMLLRAAVKGPQCDDPWLDYKNGQAWRFDSVLARTRHEVAR
jgi:tetratricopeptide (TPR) repeat protein